MLATLLGTLPLPELVRLSSSSRKLRDLAQGSAAALDCVNLREVPPQHSAAAAQWLLARPSLASVTHASLPLDAPFTPALLSALPSLRTLDLFEAPRALLMAAPGRQPALASLALDELGTLKRLALSIPYGALVRGDVLRLPTSLAHLSLSASGFATAVNCLPMASLPALARLEISVADAHSSKALAKLTALPALRHLHVGRCWTLPPELPLPGLESVDVDLYGRVVKGSCGGGLERVSHCWLRGASWQGCSCGNVWAGVCVAGRVGAHRDASPAE